MILDTTVIIDILREDSKTIDKIKEIQKSTAAILTTSITVFELWQGLEIKDSKKREKILNILQSIGLLSFDFNSAKEAGNIYRELRKKGITIDAEDTMIAGIAKIYNETLLTRNVKDFRRIENLKVEGY